MNMKSITFKNKAVDVAGTLYFPRGFDETKQYAALACVHPGSAVKEQSSGLYARKMAATGYVTLAFDASYQGASGGEPRSIEEPAARVEDIRCAVDFLTTLPFVDEHRIGVLGVCAGGGYSVNAAMTDHRIRAVGTVVPINIGRARRTGDGSEGFAIRTLEEVGKQRTKEARGEAPLMKTWVPNSLEEATRAGITGDVLEAVEYYRTPRAHHPNSNNQLRFTSVGSIMAFDAFHLVDELLTQPLLIIVGDRTGSFGSHAEGHRLYDKVTCEKDLLVIHGASHVDMYDKPEYVDQAVEALTVFYGKNLSGDARRR